MYGNIGRFETRYSAFGRRAIPHSAITLMIGRLQKTLGDLLAKSDGASVGANQIHLKLANFMGFKVNSALIYCIQLVIVRQLGGSIVEHGSKMYYKNVKFKITP